MAWTNLLNALFLPGKPILGSTGMALRDNLPSAFAGDADAPRILAGAFPTFAIGAVVVAELTGSATRANNRAAGSGNFEEVITSATMANGGSLRISAEISSSNGGIKIYKNGTVLATMSGAGFAVVTYDLTYSANDFIEIVKLLAPTSGASATLNYRNLRLLGDQRGPFRL